MKSKNTLLNVLLLTGGTMLAASSASATSATWDGSTDQTWAEGTNWTGDAAPGATSGTTSADVATFGTTGTGTITVDANRNISGINFNGNSNAFTLSGGNLLLTNAGTIQTSGAGSGHTDTISTAIELQGDGGTGFFTAGSSTATRLLVIGGGVTGVSTGSNVTTLTLNGANTGNNAVNGIIGDGSGGGKLALVKSGAGIWNLGNTNTYSGGTTINGGQLRIASDANLGAASGGITFGGSTTSMISLNAGTSLSLASSRTITVGSGSIAAFGDIGINSAITTSIAGRITGDGGIQFAHYQLGSAIANVTNTANDFKGAVILGTSNSLSGTYSSHTLNIASLADGVGYGNIVFGRGNGASSNVATFAWSNSATSALVLNNRRIELDSTVEQAVLNSDNANSLRTVTINTDLLISRAGNKTLTLGGANTGLNAFNGDIADSVSPAAVISLTKAGAGTWAVSGTNTYTGATRMAASNGTLIFQNADDSLPTATALGFDINNNQNGTIRLLSDTSGTLNYGNGIRTVAGGSSGTGTMSIFVGNNGAANLGNGAGGTTDSTMVLGTLDFRSSAEAAGLVDSRMASRFNITGANGYNLQVGDVILQGIGTGSANGAFLNPTTASLTITGTVKQANGRTAASVAANQKLTLDGTSTGNLISGAIKNATDFDDSTNANAAAMSLVKSNTSTWTLKGANTYSGGTTITTGKLLFSGANALPTTGTIAVGAAGHLSIADGTARNQTVSALTLTSLANLSFDWTGSGTGDQLTSTADITPTAGSNIAINLNRSGTPGGSVTLLTGGATSTLSSSTFYLSNATDYSATLTTPTANTLVVDNYAAQTALTTIYWVGNKLATTSLAGVDNAWTLSDGTKSNWSSSTTAYTATPLTPGATANVIFANGQVGKAQQSTVLGADVTINSLVIDDSTAVTIAGANGAALTLMSSLSTAGTVSGTPGSAITVTSNANATSTISSKVILGADQTWNVANAKTLSVTGGVSGDFSLTKADAGILRLSGASTYTGDTIISGGTLVIGDIPTGNTSTAGTLGDGSYAGGISIAAGANFNYRSNSTQTLSGVISGAGDVRMSGNGTLILSGLNTYTGTTTSIGQFNGNGGTLVVSSFNSVVNNNSALLASSSLGAPTTDAKGIITFGGGVQAGIVLRYTGTGESTNRVIALAWNGSGSRTIENNGTGPLQFTSNFTSGGAVSGGLALTGTGIGIISGNLPLNSTGNGLTKNGTGTWTLSGTNAYTTATTVAAGTLVARSAQALGTGGTANVSITAGAALNYVAAADTTLDIGGTLTINGGTNTTIGGSIGSTATSASVNVAGNALVPTAAVAVNVYGVSGVSRPGTADVTTTKYTLVSGLGGGATTLNNGSYTLGTVFNNTDFTVSNITKSTTGVFIDVTKRTALASGAYYVGGLTGASNVWAASNGSSASNFSASSGGVSQALVPGSAASVIVDNNSYATSTVLGADMSISGLTISDNTSNFALNADGYGLTLGANGITKSNTTTRTATIASNLVLGAAQTWSNSDTGNALVITGIVTGANDLIVAGAGNTTVTGRLMTGAGALTKNGAGTLALNSSNTYTGATTVSAGKLLINGNISTSSLTTVAAGATLGGTGTIGVATIDGVLAPGNSIGTLSTTGDVTWNANPGNAWAYELGLSAADLTLANTTGTRDLLNITGAGSDFLKGTGTGFTFDFANTGEVGYYKLVDWIGTTNFVDADFTATNLASGLTGTFIVDSGTSALYLNVAIPEPSIALLGGLGALLLLRRRR